VGAGPAERRRQPGQLLDGDGRATLGTTAVATRLALAPDGKIVVVGSIGVLYCSDSIVARVNPDGGLDSSFDGDGWLTTDYLGGCDGAADVAVQPDGRIVVVGSVGTGFSPTDVTVVRYNTDGSLDNSFDGDGRAVAGSNRSEGASAVLLQPDVKILVAGTTGNGNYPYRTDNQHKIVLRFQPDGSLDTSFGGDGMASANHGLNDAGAAIGLQADGRIVVAGTLSYFGFALYWGAARFNADGSLDASFSDDGLFFVVLEMSYHYANDLALGPDSRIVIAGTGLYDFNGTGSFIALRLDPGPVVPPDADEDGVLDV
jgi:uncharacterized delta-60 repeat protein